MHLQTSDQAAAQLGFGGVTCNWGTHIAGIYETKEERDEIVMRFLSEGCRRGDLQLCCVHEQSRDEFCAGFTSFAPDCSGSLASKEVFLFRSPEDLYYPDGIFSPRQMDRTLSEFYEATQVRGSRNIRATADMSWALQAIPGVEHLMAYESHLNHFISGKPWISICMYNASRFSGRTIMDVLRTHPYVINCGVITENPYYRDPDDGLD